MSYSVSRLTLYAVLSSIEEDLRDLIADYLSIVGKTTEELLGEELFSKLIKRVETDLGEPSQEFDVLVDYMDFSDSYKLLNSYTLDLPKDLAKYIKSITPILERLAPIRNRVAHSRPLNFDDLSTVLDAASEFLHASPIWKDLSTTLKRLRDEPSFVLNIEIPSYYIQNDNINQNHNLPLPDFDETGFLGRQQQIRDLIKLCTGPYPVISVIGEGSIGKTALALKVAYEILDLPKCPFDAIVWTTSKTTQLTPQEIVKIEGAIHDSLGMFKHLASELAGKSEQNSSIDEVLAYLEAFKILLILDNLETVLDDRVRSFLERLPVGSKILITSRIGLGAFEIPYRLNQMDEIDATELLRTLAKVRGLEKIRKMDQKILKNYCIKMKNSPGYIKWFVSAIQAGIRPEEVLDKNEMFLDFCMSNVYQYLLPESRKVLNAMLSVPGQHSQAELAFLNDMDVLELQKALQQLLTTPMVIMSSMPIGSSFTSQYALADLAREYLAKRYSPHPEEFAMIQKRLRQLIADKEKAKEDQRSRPYSPRSIFIRTQSDFIVARYLQRAITYTYQKVFNDADKEIQKARNLAPEYFEVHRVDAWVKVAQRNFPAAQHSYEAALELEPKHAPLWYWYGDFFLRYLNNAEEAIKSFDNAFRLDPTSIDVQLAIARSNLYLLQYEKAQATLTNILDNDLITEHDRRKAYDLYLQTFARQADYYMERRNYQLSIQFLQEMKRIYDDCPPRLIDNEMKEKLRKSVFIAETCRYEVDDPNLQRQASFLATWMYSEIAEKRKRKVENASTSPLSGMIVKMPYGKFYGFIRTDIGDEIFFHRDDLYDKLDWQILNVGARVRFAVYQEDEHRFKAVAVRLESKEYN